jgi:hypothetical protein
MNFDKPYLIELHERIDVNNNTDTLWGTPIIVDVNSIENVYPKDFRYCTSEFVEAAARHKPFKDEKMLLANTIVVINKKQHEIIETYLEVRMKIIATGIEL